MINAFTGLPVKADGAEKERTISFSGSAQNQSQVVNVPDLGTVTSVSTTNGSVNYNVSGNNVTINVSNGSSSSQSTYSPYAQSKYVTVNSSSTSPNFPSSYGYNDGTYSGTLSYGGYSTSQSSQPVYNPHRYSKNVSVTDWSNWTSTNPNDPNNTGDPWTRADYYSYSDGDGYSGSIPFRGWTASSHYDAHGYICDSPCYAGTVYKGGYEDQTITTYIANYYGYVYAPGYVTSTYYPYQVTLKYTMDNTPPDISLSATNNSKTFTVTANVTDSQSGVALKKWAKGSQTASYFASSGTAFTGATVTIPAEGIYTFYAKDNAGNEAVQTISLSFDSTPPDGHGIPSTKDWTNQDVTIHFTATDSGSGVQSITLPDGQTVCAASADYTVSSNGTYNFIATDKAGNKKTIPVTVSNIDKTAPTGTGTLSKTKWTCGNVVISFAASDDLSGVASIKTPEGTVINGSTASYTATDNGTYNFTVQDNAGNTAVVPVIVSNIDRSVSVTHPLTVNYTIDPNAETLTAQDISIKNNSQHIGVSVAVQDFTTSGINNVLPDSISDWHALTAAQTAGSISLGIAVKESAPTAGGWFTISQTTPFYVAGKENPVQLGVIDANGTGNLELSAKYGLAWAKKTAVQHNITLMFNCADVD